MLIAQRVDEGSFDHLDGVFGVVRGDFGAELETGASLGETNERLELSSRHRRSIRGGARAKLQIKVCNISAASPVSLG